MEVHTIAGIPTHRAVDAVTTFDINGPETKSLQMPSHAADLFDEAVAAELKRTQEAASDHSKEDLTADIEDLSTTIATIQAVLTRAELHRSK